MSKIWAVMLACMIETCMIETCCTDLIEVYNIDTVHIEPTEMKIIMKSLWKSTSDTGFSVSACYPLRPPPLITSNLSERQQWLKYSHIHVG